MENFKYEEYTVTAENISLTLLILSSDGNDENLIALTRHTHAHNEMFACVSGNITVFSEFGDYTVQAGEVLFIPAGIKHTLKEAPENSRWCAFEFSFKRERAGKVQDLFGIISSAFTSSKPLKFKSEAAEIYKLISATRTYSSPALNLLTLLLEMANRKNISIASNLISRLEYIINSCFMQNINASVIAERLNISTRQLARAVKKRYGDSLHSVICKKRLETAVYMLKHTNKSLDEIYQEVGFSNRNSFFREFKKQYGVTPSKYRKL